jgi:hypothetical protein
MPYDAHFNLVDLQYFKNYEICEFFFILCRKIMQHYRDVLFVNFPVEQSLVTQNFIAIRQLISELKAIGAYPTDPVPFIEIKSLKISITDDDVTFYKTLLKLDLSDLRLIGPIGLHRLLSYTAGHVFTSLQPSFTQIQEVEEMKRIRKSFYKIFRTIKHDATKIPYDPWCIMNQNTKFSSLIIHMKISYN